MIGSHVRSVNEAILLVLISCVQTRKDFSDLSCRLECNRTLVSAESFDTGDASVGRQGRGMSRGTLA